MGAHNLRQNAPAQGALNTAKKAIRTLVEISQTRFELAIVELEEEKAHLFKLLLLCGICLLCTLFSILGAFVLIFLSVPPEFRLIAFRWITGLLFLLAIVTGAWALIRAHRASLLQETRTQLKKDLQALGVSDE
ncbi:phage holin family protein [Serratia nevei]|uniref:phage holin family protein n=1 Tax=Serratia nevei TaxID=2703794 RepID=UPI003FA78985